MTREQWDLTIRSKIDTSWNLSQLLPDNLDFFVLLSSVAGLYGSASQSNYAAGCTFQDALARSLVLRGQRAISLDIGWMRTIGIIAETEEYQVNRRNIGDMGQIETEEFFSVLEVCCDPLYPLSAENCQLVMGVIRPKRFRNSGILSPEVFKRPLLSGFMNFLEREQKGDAPGISELTVPSHTPKTREELTAVVTQGLAEKLARALDISSQEVNTTKTLPDFGVDSLMAIELRDWIKNEFQAEVTTLDMMSGTTIAAIGALIASTQEGFAARKAQYSPCPNRPP
jgi:acyl carrier protein